MTPLPDNLSDIRILLADDDAVVRESLPPLLNACEGLRVVAVAKDGAEALTLMGSHNPDVVLLDVDMPLLDGPQTARLIKRSFPRAKIVMLTVFEQEAMLGEALRAGALGFLTKDQHPDELAYSIRKAARGEKVIAPRPADLLTASYIATITDREEYREFIDAVEALPPHLRPVFARIAQAKTNREIVRETKLSEATVRSYVSEILTRTGCTSRGQLGILSVKARIDAHAFL